LNLKEGSTDENAYRFAVTAHACLALPAMADIPFYNNGAPNFTTDAWTINSGFSVSDSYMTDRCGSGSCDLTALSIGVWLFTAADGVDMGLDICVGTSPFGTDGGCNTQALGTFEDQGSNQFGFEVGVETFTGLTDKNCGGACWLTLANATASSGDPIFWDENSGPSQAFESSVGSIPSEAFSLTGTPKTGTTPEPSSIMLFGSGILGLAGVLRRRLNR
jgi:PEP-CTERM motif